MRTMALSTQVCVETPSCRCMLLMVGAIDVDSDFARIT